MKSIGLFIFLIPFFCNAQQTFQGYVKDADSKEPLSFCFVGIKDKSKSVITNEDGLFNIESRSVNDTLVIAYLGFKTIYISAGVLSKTPVVWLQRQENILKEIVVSGNDDSLYLLMENARKKLMASDIRVSRAYLEVETDKNELPVNMLESYFNAYTKSSAIDKIEFKAGRVALAPTADSGYFLSDDASRLIALVHLTQKNDYLPWIPFQLKRSQMKKKYLLKLADENDNAFHLIFTPRDKKDDYFAGEVWLDKKSNALLKIILSADSCRKHPFVAFAGGIISDFSLHIIETFDLAEGKNELKLIQCNYSQNYKNNNPSSRKNNGPDSAYRLETECLMYFYNYNNPFIKPYFNFHPALSDYRKITFFPYNESFWQNSEGLLLSEKQNKRLQFIMRNGLLFNYNEKFNHQIFQNNKVSKRGFFEHHYIYWSSQDRISIKKDLNVSQGHQNKDQQNIRASLYQLKAQLLLDLNSLNDSLQITTAAVFDVYETYYHLPSEMYTDCFVNIYFDIFELERRKLEKNISATGNDTVRIDSLYKSSTREIELITKQYLKEVQSGKNFKKLKKWNDYISENLGVDNFKVFGIVEKQGG